MEDLDIASYADNTTIYTVNEQKSVISVVETSSSLLFGWFINNFMDLKSKNHLIMRCAEATTTMTDGFSSDSSKTKVLLGIAIDHELKFDDMLIIYAKKPV